MDDETPVGELLFKLMMKKPIIDTISTATHLWDNLANLDTYMPTVNLDIENLLELSPMGTLGMSPSPGYNPDVNTGKTDARHSSVQRSTYQNYLRQTI